MAAIERDQNTIADYDVDRATKLAVLKLVGYTEVIHALLPRMNPESSVVLFGGRAKDRPYPGSITVSTVNGGVVGLVNALALEMAPIRVNALHPGIVGDSPFWSGKPEGVLDGLRLAGRRPGGWRRMADIVDGGRLPAREPRRQRHQPVRRRRVAGHMTDPLRVAVVGTGRMGAAMAGRVAAAGHALTRLEPDPRHRGGGGRPARRTSRSSSTAREAAAAADVVIVSLADDAAVRATYRGDDGLVAGLAPGDGGRGHQHGRPGDDPRPRGRGPCDRRGAGRHPGLRQRLERRGRHASW